MASPLSSTSPRLNLESPQPPPTESILTALLNEISTIPDDFVLVLDDNHVIEAKPVDDALAFRLAGALDLLDEAERLYHRSPVPDVRPVAALKTRVWIAQGTLAEARDWVSEQGLTITQEEGGETLLTGPVVDQAALHGLLRRVRDLGIPLLSVVRSEEGGQACPNLKR